MNISFSSRLYIPFFLFFIIICSSSMAAEANNVFQGVPATVKLPDCSSGKTVTLIPLKTGKPVTMELIGGETAIPLTDSFKQKKSAGTVTEVVGYTLEPGKTKDGKASWKIKYNSKGRKATCITLKHDGQNLTFKWRTKVPQKYLLPIANCVLKMTLDSSTHYLALREAVRLESPILNPKSGTFSAKTSKLDYPFPDLDLVTLELQNIGPFKPGGTDIIFPPATKISSIAPKTPLQITFNFKDANGNVNRAFAFDVNPSCDSSFGISLTPPKEFAKPFVQMLQMAMDPQIDIMLNKNRTEISQINQKLEKQEGWKRDAKDTNRIAELQRLNWGFEQLKRLKEADAKVRVFLDYGETRVELVYSETVTPSQKKAALQAEKALKKQKEEGGPVVEAPKEDSGFNF